LILSCSIDVSLRYGNFNEFIELLDHAVFAVKGVSLQDIEHLEESGGQTIIVASANFGGTPCVSITYVKKGRAVHITVFRDQDHLIDKSQVELFDYLGKLIELTGNKTFSSL